MAAIQGAETIAYATETDENGNSYVRIWAGTADKIWQIVDELRLPVWRLAAEEEDERDESWRWADGYQNIRGGGCTSPVYVEDVCVESGLNVCALLALDAAIWLAGNQGADEPLAE